MASKVSIVKAKTYDEDEVYAAVRRSVDLLGGIENFIKRGEKVLLKPNLLAARPPESGINTHPEILRASIKLAREAGAGVIVGDSPGGFGFKHPSSAYEASGVKKVCEEEGVELVEFSRAHNVNGIPIAAYAKEVDAVISIPKMKTHSLTTLTGAVKNSYGLAVGPYKTICHVKAPRPRDFAEYLVGVFECAVPRLVIMDGIVAMEGDGPASGGELRQAGLILASGDCVACDTVFARLAGIAPLRVETTAEAYKRRLGEADFSKIEILGETLEAAAIKDFKLPKTSVIMKIPPVVFKLLTRGIKFWPHIDDKICTRCQMCAKSCPAGCITIKKETTKIDYRKCVACFCCFEVCPYKAISIKQSLLVRLLSRL